MSGVIWKDGLFVDADVPCVSHRDSGFTNALGVFDVMRCEDGIAQDMALHLARLARDAQSVLGLTVDIDVFAAAIPDILARNDLTKGFTRLRSVITGGVSDAPLTIGIPTMIMSAARCAAPQTLPPLTCTIVRDYPRIAGCTLENAKCLDYTRAFAARRKAREMGAEDAILLNTNGDVACATTSNLFIVEHGQYITPPLADGVLDGITRRGVLREKQGFEQSISLNRLHEAERIYVCNSPTGLRQVILI